MDGRGHDSESKSGGTREKILAVAEELIARDGFEQFQLKEIAERLGISPPAIFAHFKGRNSVAEEVARRVLEALVELGRSVGSRDPEEELRGYVRGLVANFVEHPAHLRIMLSDLAKGGAASELDRVTDVVAMMGEQTQQLLDRGLRNRRFRPIRRDAFSAQMLGSVLSLVAWHGWDREGQLILRVPVAVLQREAEELVLALVRPEPRAHT